jgi:hypothetical protein
MGFMPLRVLRQQNPHSAGWWLSQGTLRSRLDFVMYSMVLSIMK